MASPGRRRPSSRSAGAELIVNLSASPFHVGRAQEREAIFTARARESGVRVALCNTVGGQDELVFDGHSLLIESDGTVLARAPGFEETLLCSISIASRGRRSQPLGDDVEQMRQALVLGLGDYVRKNGFGEIVVGVSGGIDSAVTAALAVDALGSERVHCVSMPSRYSSEGTRTDARAARREPRLRLPRAPDRAGRRGVRLRARASPSPDASPTSPRRTSRRGSAARC